MSLSLFLSLPPLFLCSIQKEHAVISLTGSDAEIKPVSANAKIKVNGVPVAATRTLDHKDRIIFGRCFVALILLSCMDKIIFGTCLVAVISMSHKEGILFGRCFVAVIMLSCMDKIIFGTGFYPVRGLLPC